MIFGEFITFTGRFLQLDEIKPEDICIEDIAHSLSMQCRYNGHVGVFYSVAQHSVLSSLLVPERLALAALLHDAAEAYTGDVISPIKCGMPQMQALEARFNAVIERVFDLQLTAADRAMIRRADLQMLAAERRDLWDHDAHDWKLEEMAPMFIGVFSQIKPWEPKFAESAFRSWFSEYELNRSDVALKTEAGNAVIENSILKGGC